VVGAVQASTVEHVTPGYPPTFITDGNTGSFEGDARKLEAKLKENGVYVVSLYYPVEHAKLNHEYQLDYSIPESIECYNRTLALLRQGHVE
jgi:acetyl esterase/lipase